MIERAAGTLAPSCVIVSYGGDQDDLFVLAEVVVVRPHTDDLHNTLVGDATLLKRLPTHGIHEPMLDVYPPRVKTGEAPHEPFVGWRCAERILPHDGNERLGLCVQSCGPEPSSILCRLFGELHVPHDATSRVRTRTRNPHRAHLDRRRATQPSRECP